MMAVSRSSGFSIFFLVLLLPLTIAAWSYSGFGEVQQELVEARSPGSDSRSRETEGQLGEARSTRRRSEEEPWLDPYLPEYITPISYNLWLYPQFYNDDSVFNGRIAIDIHIAEDTDVIIVHIKDMNSPITSLINENGDILFLDRTFNYTLNEYHVVLTQEVIPANSNVTLTMIFNGSLLNGIVGFYKSTYRNDVTGEMSWLATSKFQPSDARKAFPNFDEPRFKTPFTLTMRHWTNFTTLFNTPVERVVNIDSDWSETTFQTTPPMSSYLVCFIVCDFKSGSNLLGGGQPHKVWARPDRMPQTEYALWAGPVVEDYFVELFDVPYPLPKLDQVGIPDYPSGATEHWGLITYRDTRLLYDEDQVSDYDKQRVLSIISHELAHNHVGDLVTCRYWDDIWLNEGFATYYSVKGMVHADSSMYADGQFFTRTMQSIMGSDAVNSSRAVVVKITNPDEANAAFDGIAYDKGASLLSMMEGFLGTETFNSGITRYLEENSFKTVVTDDLWAAFDGLDMKEIMSPWIYSMGYPVVEISRLPGNQLQASQRRFLLNPTSDPDSPPTTYGYKWYVPLKYRTESGSVGQVWLNLTDAIFNNPAGSETEWIKFNYDHTGYYRVNYPLDMWAAIALQLSSNPQAFTDLERANLLSDALALSRAAQLDYHFALDLTKYLAQEDEFLPWDSALSPLMFISDMLYSTPADYSLWQDYVVQITKNLMDELKVEDSGIYVEKLTRTNIIKLSCDNGYQPCLDNTTTLFKAWIFDEITNPVPNNLKREVYAFGMSNGGTEEDWNTVWDRYTTATSGQEQDNLLYSLTRAPDLTLIQRLLDYSMDQSVIRSQDFFTVITYIQSNRAANNYLWNWAQEMYEEIVARFGLGNRSLGRMIPGIVNYYNTAEKLREVEDFYARYPEAGTGQRFREESLQNIQANILWVERNLETIRDWLNDNLNPFEI